MLAVNIGSEGFMGVMWVIFTLTGSGYFAIGILDFLLGRARARRP